MSDRDSGGLTGWIGSVAIAATGVLAAITTTATALVAVAGGGQRVLVNQPIGTIASLVLVTIGMWAVFLVLLTARRERTSGATQTDKPKPVDESAPRMQAMATRSSTRQIAALGGAVGLIVVGALVGVWVIVVVGSTPQQPHITATIGEDLVLRGTARSSELPQDRRLWVIVYGYYNWPWPVAEKDALLIAQSGPGGADTVELPFSVSLPPRKYLWVGAKAWEAHPATPGDPGKCVRFEEFGGSVELRTTTDRVSCVFSIVPNRVAGAGT